MKARISLSTCSTHEFATKSSERQLKSLVKKKLKKKNKTKIRYKIQAKLPETLLCC